MVTERTDKISCPKFGGSRIPHSCIVFDRYKSCRKNCSALKRYLEENPQAREDAMRIIEKPAQDKIMLPCEYAGKGLPVPTNPEFVCDICKYEAKSTRGLKSHKTRAHGIKEIKRKKIKKRIKKEGKASRKGKKKRAS